MAVNAPADRPEGVRPFAPESAPSATVSDEPSAARTAGLVGLGLTAVGIFAVIMNRETPRLIGPASGAVIALAGVAAMLYHAARDPDRLVRRAYIGLGIAALSAGVVLSLVPNPKVGDWFIPWGVAGLLSGTAFLLAGGRQEDEAPWPHIIAGLLTLTGVAATLIGFVGVGWPSAATLDLVPRFSGVTALGLIGWWAAISRLGVASDAGFRLGQLLGLVGLAAVVVALGRSVVPGLLHSWGVAATAGERYFVPRGLALTSLGTLAVALSYAVCSDRPIVAMTRRELAAYFYSPVAYLVLLGMAFVSWLGYQEWMGQLVRRAGQPVTEPVVSNYIVNIIPVFGMMFAVPAITMRLFAEEKRTGTLEVLLTAPVSEVSVVLSKFIAALVYFLILVLPWGLFLIPVYFESRAGFDYLPLLGFYVALLASGAAFVSMGVFFSSLTRNQIVAASLTFAGMVAYLSIVFVVPRTGGALKSVLEQFSFIDVWFNSLSGKLYLHNVITFGSIAAFWLFLSVKVLESRKWS
jgi:ABC-type transport system involved in multi-copper enzyme maturation permease subunit